MKRFALILSLILIFTSVPVTSIASSELDADELLVKKIVEEFGGLIDNLDESDLLDLFGISLILNDNSDQIIQASYNEIDSTGLKDKLYPAGITSENMSALVGYINEALVSSDKFSLALAMLNYVENPDSEVPTEITSFMKSLRQTISDNLPSMVNDLNNSMREEMKNKKGEFGVELLSAVYNNMILIKNDYDQPWDVGFTDSFNSEIKQIFEYYTTFSINDSDIQVLMEAFIAAQEQIFLILEDDFYDGVNSENIERLEYILKKVHLLDDATSPSFELETDYDMYFMFNNSSSSSSDRENASVYLRQEDYNENNVVIEGMVKDPEQNITSIDLKLENSQETITIPINSLSDTDEYGFRYFSDVDVTIDLSTDKEYTDIYALLTYNDDSTTTIDMIGYIPLRGYNVESISIDNTPPIIEESPEFDFMSYQDELEIYFRVNEDLFATDDYFRVVENWEGGQEVVNAINEAYCYYSDYRESYILRITVDKSQLEYGKYYKLIVSNELSDNAGNTVESSWKNEYVFEYETRPLSKMDEIETNHKVYIYSHYGASWDSEVDYAKLFINDNRLDENGNAYIYGYINDPNEEINNVTLYFENDDGTISESVAISDFNRAYDDGNGYFNYVQVALGKESTTEYTNVYAIINGQSETKYDVGLLSYKGGKIVSILYDNERPVIDNVQFDYTSSDGYIEVYLDVDTYMGLWSNDLFRVYNTSNGVKTSELINAIADAFNMDTENGPRVVILLDKSKFTEDNTYILEVSDEITDMAGNTIDQNSQREWSFKYDVEDNNTGGGSTGGGGSGGSGSSGDSSDVDVNETTQQGDEVAEGIEDKSGDEAADDVNEYIDEAVNNTLNNEDVDGDEATEVVEKAVEVVEMLLDKEDLSADKAVEVVEKVIENTVSMFLDNEDVDAETASDVVENILENVVSNTLDNEDVTTEQAKEIVEKVIENNINKLMEKDTEGIETDGVKDTLVDMVNKVISKAGSVDSDNVTIESTEKESKVLVDISGLDEAAEKAMEVASDMTKKLEENGVSELADIVKKEVVIKVPEEANDTEEVKVEIPTAAFKNLEAKGVDLAVEAKNVKFKLPAALADLAGENLQVSVKEVDKATEEDAKAKANEVEDGTLNPAGKLYDLNLTSGEQKIESFKNKPIIEIPLDDVNLDDVDIDKLGAYVFNEETGQWDYVRSKIVNNTLVFEAPHFSIYTVMEYEKEFVDTLNHWAKEDIEIMAAKHIAKGVDKNNFAPNNTITRAEFAALVVRALGLEGKGNTKFDDVSSEAWYANEVALAADGEIVDGVGHNMFAPNESITREQMAAMVARAYKVMKGRELKGNEVTFSDKDLISSWAIEAVKGAVKKSIITGYDEDNTFRPKDKATRAHGIVMLRRLLEQ